MKILQLLASVVLIGVGAWAKLYYKSIEAEIKGGSGYATSGTFDSSFCGSGKGCSTNSGSWTSHQKKAYQPRSESTSGVQSNPYLSK